MVELNFDEDFNSNAEKLRHFVDAEDFMVGIHEEDDELDAICNTDIMRIN